MTVATIATHPNKISDTELSRLKHTFYDETGLKNIRLETLSDNSITIIGPNGSIGVADDFFKENGWIIEYADLIVLRRTELVKI